jgi:hypothetical protein
MDYWSKFVTIEEKEGGCYLGYNQPKEFSLPSPRLLNLLKSQLCVGFISGHFAHEKCRTELGG